MSTWIIFNRFINLPYIHVWFRHKKKKMHLHFYNLHSFPYLTFYITTGSLCTIFIILPTLIWKMLLHICAPCFTCVIELLYNSGCHLGIKIWKITDLQKCQSNCENCIQWHHSHIDFLCHHIKFNGFTIQFRNFHGTIK